MTLWPLSLTLPRSSGTAWQSRQDLLGPQPAPSPIPLNIPPSLGPSLFNTAPSTAAWFPEPLLRCLHPAVSSPPTPTGLTISQEHDDIPSHFGVEILKPEGILQGLLSLVSPILGVFLFLCRDRETRVIWQGWGQLFVPRHYGYPNFSCLRARQPGLGRGSQNCLPPPATVWSVDHLGQPKAQRCQSMCPGPHSSGSAPQNLRCFLPPSRETFC